MYYNTEQLLRSMSLARSRRRRRCHSASNATTSPQNRRTIDANTLERLATQKLESMLQKDSGKKILQHETTLHGGDEEAAKKSMFEYLKLQIRKLRNVGPLAIVANNKQTASRPLNSNERRVRATTAPAVLSSTTSIRKDADPLEQWAKAVREDPKCQTTQFCSFLHAISESMQRTRKENRVPDYASIRSATMDQCKCLNVWDQQHEKYARALIDAVRIHTAV